MKRLLIGPALGLLGLVGCGGGQPTTTVTVTEKPHPQKLIATAGVSDLVASRVEELSGYLPEAKCPTTAPAVKGGRFTCEALLEGVLVPIEVEIASPLGFFRVVDTPALRRFAREAGG